MGDSHAGIASAKLRKIYETSLSFNFIFILSQFPNWQRDEKKVFLLSWDVGTKVFLHVDEALVQRVSHTDGHPRWGRLVQAGESYGRGVDGCDQ